MNNRIKAAVFIFALLAAAIAFYFIPVDITLTPMDRSVNDGGEKLTVAVKNINIYRIPFSKARIDKATIEPDGFASLSTPAVKWQVDITFLQNGSGKLVVESGRHRGELALSSTAAAKAEPKDSKPKSRLKALYDKHKHVEKVFLRDGMVLYGVIFEKGKRIDFITPDGTLKLSKDDIVRVVYLKPENL